jgi:hypothetical protein
MSNEDQERPSSRDPNVRDGDMGGHAPPDQNTGGFHFIITLFLFSLAVIVLFSLFAVVSALLQDTHVLDIPFKILVAFIAAGAGAVVGGTASVRTTFESLGLPFRAEFGGAVAMFAIAGAIMFVTPNPREETFDISIRGIPEPIVQNSSVYTVEAIPEGPKSEWMSEINGRALKIALQRPLKEFATLFRITGSDGFIVGECTVEFRAGRPGEERKGSKTILVNNASPQTEFRFSRRFLDHIVDLGSQPSRKRIQAKDCVEANFSKDEEPAVLDGLILIAERPVMDRIRAALRGPSVVFYAVQESEKSEPNVTEADVSPKAAISGPKQAPPKPIVAESSQSPPSSETHQDTIPELAPSHPTKSAEEASRVALPPLPSESKQSSLPSGRPTAPSTNTTPATTTTPAPSQPTDLVDQYLKGAEFDRSLLYQSWSTVQQSVVEGFRRAYDANDPLLARYIHLIANALGEIDNKRYAPPARNPNFGHDKPERLTKANGNIPGFQDADYAKVVYLLMSDNEDVRKAAQRLIRVFPVNPFYWSFEKLRSNTSLTGTQFARLHESVQYYFYTRIVEMQGSYALDDGIVRWVDGNYRSGLQWLDIERARVGSGKPWEAMLLYAKGLVFIGRKYQSDDARTTGLEAFKAMLDQIKKSEQDYPSNPQNIAVALAVVNNPARSTANFSAAGLYPPGDTRSLDAFSYNVSGSIISLYALPDTSSAQQNSVSTGSIAKMILSSEGWDLVQVKDALGWAKRKDNGNV